MKIPKNVIFGCEAEKNKKNILKALKKDKFLMDIYIITIPKKDGLLEIYPSYVLTKFDVYKNKDMQIFGIADGYDEALNIVQDSICNCYNTQGDFDLKRYLTL